MDKFDLQTQTLRWVWGACILWNQWASQFSSTDSPVFQSFVHRTHTAVWHHLTRGTPLDGSYSDFECDLALKAVVVFGALVEK